MIMNRTGFARKGDHKIASLNMQANANYNTLQTRQPFCSMVAQAGFQALDIFFQNK
jgi:hypothetical protein